MRRAIHTHAYSRERFLYARDFSFLFTFVSCTRNKSIVGYRAYTPVSFGPSGRQAAMYDISGAQLEATPTHVHHISHRLDFS